MISAPAVKKPLPATGSARASTSTAPGTISSSAVPPRNRPSFGPPAAARATLSSNRRNSSLDPAGKTGVGVGVSTDSAIAAEEHDARALAATKISDLQQQIAASDREQGQLAKKAEALQARLDEAVRDSSRFEERAHELEEQIEALRHEKREVLRQIREMELIYEAERSSMIKERDETATREEEMQSVIKRLKDSLLQRDDDGRPSRQSNHSPTMNGSFAPPATLTRTDSGNNSKLLLHKDKVIESLRLELAEAQIKLVELDNQGGGRLQEVERQLMEARMANARLMEENEGFELLLEEKTLAGEFDKGTLISTIIGGRSSTGPPGGTTTISANQDALNALEGRIPGGGREGGDGGEDGDRNGGGRDRGGDSRVAGTGASSSLADELSESTSSDAGRSTDVIDSADGPRRGIGDDEKLLALQNCRRLEAEVKTSREQNKALTLYINKIIGRLLQHRGLEHILEQTDDPTKATLPAAGVNKELPSPPTLQSTGASLLELARSIAVGRGSVNPRVRPASGGQPPPPQHGQAQPAQPLQQLPQLPQLPAQTSLPQPPQPPLQPPPGSAHTDPDRAPSIPFGSLTRSSSLRRSRPMSEQFIGANNHLSYLSHPPQHLQQHQRASLRSPPPPGLLRAQTTALLNSQQQPQQQVGGWNESATSRESATSSTVDSIDSASSPRSPHRINTAGGAGAPEKGPEKTTTFGGNKPRLLRLVQENADLARDSARSSLDVSAVLGAAKRASWIGWAWSKKEDGAPSETPIQE